MKTKTALAILAAALLLAACGNKGPLVMPQKPVPVEQELPEAPAGEATDTTAEPGLDPEAVPEQDQEPAETPQDPVPPPAGDADG